LLKKLLIIILFYSLSVFADSVDDGLSYLYSSQNTDGSWGDNSLNKFIYTSEVLRTLQIVNEKGVNYVNGLKWLQSQFPENVDFLSKKLSIYSKEGINSKELINKIIFCQNDDGGFGIKEGYESTLLHTIVALDGLSSSVDTNSNIISGLNYLIINQNSDGGYPFIKNGISSVFTTSLGLSLLSLYTNKSQVSNTIEKGVSYLVSQMNPDSGFGEGESSIYETALVLRALIKVNKRGDVREILKNYLTGRQLANGSWNNDIYETALALRSFHFTTLPDLVINSVSFEPETINEGDTAKIISSVSNIGEGVAQNINLRFYEDGVKVQDTIYNEILSGDTVNIEIPWNTFEKTGYHTIGVRIDPANLIEELSTSNNYLEKMAFVQDTVPPESLDIYVQNPYFSPNGDGIKDISSVYFRASEDVTVDVNITNKNGKIVRNLATGEFYSPGSYSLEWDGTNDTLSLLPDGDYVYNIFLEDKGGNIERRHHFVVIDRNKTPIFESLEPNRIYTKRVMVDDASNSIELLNYYPDQDYCFLRFKNALNKKRRDLVLSNGFRTYLEKLCEVDGIADLQYSDSYHKVFFRTSDYGPLFCFDIREEKLDTIVESGLMRYRISPEGNKILYYPSFKGLFLTDFEGSYNKLVDSSAYCTDWWEPGYWSPDGNLFYYLRQEDDSLFVVVLSDLSLNEKREIYMYEFGGNMTALPVSWSPDGANIVIYFWYSASKNLDIILFNVQDNQFNNVFSVNANPTEGLPVSSCQWNKAGDAFLVGSGTGSKNDGLYEIDLTQDKVKRLMDYPGYPFQYVYHDSLILYHSYTSYRELYCMDRNGKNRTFICKLPTWENIYLSKDETFFLNGEEYVGLNADNLTTELRFQRLLGTPNQLTIAGTVSDKNLEYYTLSYGEGKNPSFYQTFYSNTNSVIDTIITDWIPPYSGEYTIKLKAFDKAGNTSETSKSLFWEGDALIANLKADPEVFSPDSDGSLDSIVISYTAFKTEPIFFNVLDLEDNIIFFKHMNHPAAGEYSFAWNGRDNSGEIVENGKYFVKACGCSTPIYVDTIPPDVFFDLSLNTKSFVKNGYFDIGVRGLLYDLHFNRYALSFTHEDTSEFLPVLSGSKPIPDTVPLVKIRGLEELGMYYVKLIAEDYAGHKETLIDSIFVDSFYVEGEMEEVAGDYEFHSEARAMFPDIDSLIFNIQYGTYYFELGVGWIFKWLKACRQGKGIREGENYYYSDEPVNPPAPGYDLVKFAGKAWRGDSFVSAFDIDTLTGLGEVKGLLFVNPAYPAPGSPPSKISGIYEVEANYFVIDTLGNIKAFPEFLEWVKFQYAHLEDTSYYRDLGAQDYSFPFEYSWNTYLFHNGYYYLKAIGLDTLGDTLRTKLEVRVLNNPLIVELNNEKGPFTRRTDTLFARVLADTVFHGTIQSVKFFYIMGDTAFADTILIIEDFESPYQTLFNTEVFPDTQITFLAYTHDDIGYEAYSLPLGVIIDNTAPTVEITYPTDGMSFDSPDFIDILGNAYDKNIKSVEVDLNGSRVKFSKSNLTDTLTLLDARTLESGDYKISAIAEDMAGNVVSDSIQIVITNSPFPAVSIDTPENNSFQKDVVEISYSVKDDNLSYYVLKYAEGILPLNYTVIDSNTTSGQNKKYIMDTSILKDTIYSLVLYAKDLTDKTNGDTILFSVDNIYPEVFITYPPEHEKFNGKFPVIGNIKDKNLFRDTLFVGMGERPSLWTALVSGNYNLDNDTILIWDPFVKSDVYTFRLSAIDLAKNISEDSVTIYLDTIPPAPPEGLIAVDSLGVVDLSWEPNTEEDLEGYFLFRQGMKLNTQAFLNISYVDTLPSIEGKYYYYLTAVDELGNESKTSDTVSVKVDLSPPYVKIISPKNNQWINGIDTVMGTITDNNFLEYNLEYSPFADTTYLPIVTGLSEISYGEIYKWDVSSLEGYFNLRLRGKDTYDNSDTFEIVVRVDNTPPVMPDSLIAASNGSLVDLSWLSAADDHLAGYYLYRDGEKVKTSIITDTFAIDTVFDGDYSYTVVGTDSAGNLSLPAGPASVIVDTRAPSVIVISPVEGSKVKGTIDILTECEDKDLSSVLFRYKEKTGTWKDIKEVNSAPFATQFNIDSLAGGKFYLSAIGTDVHNNTDNSPDSVFVLHQEDLTPPASPVGLVYNIEPPPPGSGWATANLSWRRNTEDDIREYNIYKRGKQIASVPDTFFSDEVHINNTYIYNISAVDTASNESRLSDSLFVECKPPELSIHYPSPSQYEYIYGGIIPVTITVKDNNLSFYSLIYGFISDTIPHILYEDSIEVDNKTVYRWNTRNINDTVALLLIGSDIHGFSDTTGVNFIIDNLAPPAPESLEVAFLSDFVPPPIEVDSIVLHWLPVTTEEVAYNIYYSTVSGTGYVKLNDQPVLYDYYITELPGGKTYYFVVTAIDHIGHESGYSNEVSAKPRVSDIDIVVSDNDIWNFPSSPLEGDSVLTEVKVHNQGRVSANDFSLELMIEQEGKYITLKNWLVSSLSPDSVREFSVEWSTAGLAGQNKLHLLADPEDFIKETDESNNWYTLPIEIRETDFLFRYSLSDSLIPPFTDLTAYYSIINTGGENKEGALSLAIINSDSTVISTDFDLEHIIYDSIPFGSAFGEFFYDMTQVKFGFLSLTDSVGEGEQSFGFSSDFTIIELTDSQYIVQYIYLDTLNPPSEIMLQFEDKYGSKSHRAFWGSDLINRGISGTSSRKKFGSLPEKGKWVRFKVPLVQVGIYDGQIKGMEFLHYGGKMYWDGTGIGGNQVSFTLARAEEKNFEIIWNSLNYPAGKYRLKSILKDGLKISEREMPFTIEGTGGVETYVNTDKPNYNTLESVYITTRIFNNSPNQTYNNLKEFIIIVDSADYEYFSDTLSVITLLPGGDSEHQFVFSTGYSSPGMYMVKEYLLSGDDTLSSSTAEFYINPSSGEDIRISGNISAVPKLVPYPDSLTVFYSLKNLGNMAIDSLPISINIKQVDEDLTVYSIEDTISLGFGGTLEEDFRISSESLGFKPYALLLYVHPADTTVLLASSGFLVVDLTNPYVKILEPSGLVSGVVGVSAEVGDFVNGIDSVYFSIDTIIQRMNRISGDSLGGIYESEFNSRVLKDSSYILKVTAVDYFGDSFADSSLIEVRNDSAAISYSLKVKPIPRVLSITEDTLFIKSILEGMDIYYKVVSNGCAFEKGFRSGIYNIYIISGNCINITAFTQNEMKEAVFGGEGLIVLTSSVCVVKPHLFEPFGVCVLGNLPGCGYNINFEESDISHRDTLSTDGKGLRMYLKEGEKVAEFEKREEEEGCGSICLKARYPFYSEEKSRIIIKAMKEEDIDNKFVSDTFDIDSIPVFDMDEKITEGIGNIRIDSVTERVVTFSFDAEEGFKETYKFQVEILGEREGKEIGPVSIPLESPEHLHKSMNFGGFEICRVEPLCGDTLDIYPAVVENRYGAGKALLFGFNPFDINEEEDFKEKVRNAVLASLPDTEKVYINKVISPVVTIITPQLIEAIDIKEIIPEDFEVIAVLDSGEIKDYGFNWIKDVVDTAEFRSILRVSKEPFTDSILVTIDNTGLLKIFLEGEKEISEILDDVIESLENPVGFELQGKDKDRRDKAVKVLKRALNNKIKKREDLIKNIEYGITAAQLVGEIESVDYSSERKEIDKAIRIWEVMWYKWK